MLVASNSRHILDRMRRRGSDGTLVEQNERAVAVKWWMKPTTRPSRTESVQNASKNLTFTANAKSGWINTCNKRLWLYFHTVSRTKCSLLNIPKTSLHITLKLLLKSIPNSIQNFKKQFFHVTNVETRKQLIIPNYQWQTYYKKKNFRFFLVDFTYKRSEYNRTPHIRPEHNQLHRDNIPRELWICSL